MSGPSHTTVTRSWGTRELAHPVYVYGVIPASGAGRWPETPGLDGPPSIVRTVVEGGLAALVSDLAPHHTPGRREDLEAHRRVLALAIERGTTIPMRFGVVMDGDEMVRERLLARHAAELADVAGALDGQIQMSVRAFYAEDALLSDVLAGDPALARRAAALGTRPRPDTHAARVRFGEMVAAAVDRRRAEVESALVARLSPVATDIRLDPPGSERVALSAQLLVPRDRRPELDAAIQELGDALSGVLGFRYVGPLPPYSFADLSLGDDGGPAWD